VYSGAAASEAELRAAAKPGVLHLATHGFVLPSIVEKERHIPFGGRTPFTEGIRVANNPMLRSGLALAGAHRTIDAWTRGESVPPENDGIVTAEEIALLNLTNTWLVVLSACDTGNGQAQCGEGVLGLRRGFVQAGAQNLLLTLWSVDDEQTADLILDFYEAAYQLGSPVQGLAQVQRLWLARLRQQKGVAAACRLAGPFILSFKGKY
jgi:CHAT domain-containing protein